MSAAFALANINNDMNSPTLTNVLLLGKTLLLLTCGEQFVFLNYVNVEEIHIFWNETN